jgi:AcrR family transcriptional regulator
MAITTYEKSLMPESPKKQILISTASWIASRGLYKLTLAEIARQSKLSRPNLNYHYKTIDEVILDLLPIWGHSGQVVTSEHLSSLLGSSPKELILGIVEATFLWKTKCPTYAAMTSTLSQMGQNNKMIAAIMEQITDTGLQRILFLLEKIPELKSESKTLSRSIHMMLIGGFLYHLSTKKHSDIEMERIIKNSITRIIE